MEDLKFFKFGGLYFNPESMLNSQSFLRKETEGTKIIFVVSALKGMTRLLNLIVKSKLEEEHLSKNEKVFAEMVIDMSLNEFKKVHIELISNILLGKYREKAFEEFNEDFLKLQRDVYLTPNESFAALIPSYGELASSKIFSVFLDFTGIKGFLFDAPKFLNTDRNFLDARLKHLDKSFLNFLDLNRALITQGFIGSYKGKHTLLGLDGSDLSVAYLAGGAMDSGFTTSITYMKDVKGFYLQDPSTTTKEDYRLEISLADYQKLPSRPIRLDAVEYALSKGVPVHMGYFPDPTAPLATIH